ncbi:glycosyltransferase family 39 protein [Halobacteriovorax sp. JY17]|uniref:glycosyltransferase family 39 protein n=1 Tax=Halobacteriovorax sp. JY17 TaxID=2014617 RepID=UPI0025C6A81D|nr:glycosyltransferase family 39 protein [Halobacteriovorax sp. JY17]
MIALFVGIFSGYYFSGASADLIWAADSYAAHLPKSDEVAEAIRSFSLEGLRKPFVGYYRTIHIFTGLAFTVLRNPIVTGFVLLIFKIIALWSIIRLSRKLFDEKVALVSAYLYTFAPCVLFFSINFYKEMFVQAWLALSFLFFYEIFEEGKYKKIPFFVFTFFFLSMERSYVAISVLPGMAFYFLSMEKFKKSHKLVLAGGVVLITYTIRTLYFPYLGFENVFAFFREKRASWHNYDYFDQRYNLELNYFLSWIKLYFTPIFTLQKFELFFNYSILLTWGSFIHQATMALFSVGIYNQIKTHTKRTLFYVIPFFVYMCAFAYIGSFSGRTRDSYYPIIVMFAGYGLVNKVVPFLKRRMRRS